MCGLYGVIFHKTPDSELRKLVADAMHLMAGISSERGTDATGVALVSRDGSVNLYKDTVPSLEMIRRRHWRSLFDKVSPDVLAYIGHTRKRSYGQNSQKNAHPFVFTSPHGVIVGTHNGGITNHDSINPMEKKFDCDSANLFAGMSKVDDDAWPALLGKLTGAFALVFSRGGNVYFCRNMSSPLYYATDSKAGITMYSSTFMTTVSGLAMARLDWDDVPREVTPRTLLKFVPGEHLPAITDVPFIYNSSNNYSGRAWSDDGEGYEYVGGGPGVVGTSSRTGVGFHTAHSSYKKSEAMCSSCGKIRPVELLHKYGSRSLACTECYSEQLNNPAVERTTPFYPYSEMSCYD